MRHPYQTQLEAHKAKHHGLLYLTLGALGIVFGDIGTSPLYAIRECFHPAHGLNLNSANVLGILSLILWTVLAVICVKYVSIILKADNKGEGGILSLMALSVRSTQGRVSDFRKNVLTVMGLFGAALLFGEGVITPAISVLSAVEGLSLITPVFEHWITTVTIVIIIGLFAVQRYGTGTIGAAFGPIMLIWFSCIGLLGVKGIALNPEVLLSLNPQYAVSFFINNGKVAIFAMGAIVLVITGGEALYADLGHFGRKPIALAWLAVAMPALIINYMGQGALILIRPEAISNPFYLLAPDYFLWPMVILATMAAVIASQAMISGVFSIAKQAVQLGYIPRLNIVHTSSIEKGQIYVPFINSCLLLTVIWLVFTFKTSSNLAAAYGISVTLTMLISTILAYHVGIFKWGWSFLKSFLIFTPFLLIDFSFVGATSLKIAHGGYITLVIAMIVYLLMSTWQKGRRILYKKLKERSLPVEDFCKKICDTPPIRVPGTAIYMAADPTGVPVPMLHNLKHNKVLHERIVMLTISTKDVPFIKQTDRVKVEELIPNFYRVVASYGFMEIPKMKHILDACRELGMQFNVMETTFVLGRETILPSNEPGMPLWQEKLFAIMTKNAQRPTAFFKIPPNQVIEVGIQVEI